MSVRKSIHIDGLNHLTGIPVATRIGPLLISSVIAPFNPGTRQVPEGYAAQYVNIFRHVGAMLAAAEADWRHVAKMEFWVPALEARDACEAAWNEKFPDANSRPARHTHIAPDAKAVSASFIAYLED